MLFELLVPGTFVGELNRDNAITFNGEWTKGACETGVSSDFSTMA